MLSNVKLQFWGLLILCIILLALPLFIRMNYSDNLLINGGSYRDIRLAEEFNENGFVSYDKLSYGGRNFYGEQLWLALLSINPQKLVRLLPFLFGVFSFVLFYLIINKIKPAVSSLSSLLLITSSPFLYFFSTVANHTVAIFFVLLGFYLFLKKRNALAILSFFIAGGFSVLAIFLVTLIFLYKGIKEKRFNPFILSFLGFVFWFLLYFYKVLFLGLPEIFSLIKFSFSDFFTFLLFNINYSLGFFFLVLLFIGAYHFYKEKYRFLFMYLLIILLFFLIFYFRVLFIYLIFVFSYFAAWGFVALIKHDWKSQIFKFLTLLVICCGLLFNLIVFFDNVSEFYPNSSYGEAISFLRLTDINGVVFSSSENGDIIAYSGKANFMDEDIYYAPELLDREMDYDKLLTTKDIILAKSLMDKYNIQYLLLDNRMKSEFFVDGEDALLFLLKYSPLSFSLEFRNDEIEIWRRINSESGGL